LPRLLDTSVRVRKAPRVEPKCKSKSNPAAGPDRVPASKVSSQTKNGVKSAASKQSRTVKTRANTSKASALDIKEGETKLKPVEPDPAQNVTTKAPAPDLQTKQTEVQPNLKCANKGNQDEFVRPEGLPWKAQNVSGEGQNMAQVASRTGASGSALRAAPRAMMRGKRAYRSEVHNSASGDKRSVRIDDEIAVKKQHLDPPRIRAVNPSSKFVKSGLKLHTAGDLQSLLDDLVYQQQGLDPAQKVGVQQASAIQIAVLSSNPKIRQVLRARNLLSPLLSQLSALSLSDDEPGDYTLCLATIVTMAAFAKNKQEASSLPSSCILFLLSMVRSPPQYVKPPIQQSSGEDQHNKLVTTAHALGVCGRRSLETQSLGVAKAALRTLDCLLQLSSASNALLLSEGGFGTVADMFNGGQSNLRDGSAEDTSATIKEMILCLKVLTHATCCSLDEKLFIMPHRATFLSSLCSALGYCKKMLSVPDFDFEGESVRELTTEYILGVLRVLVNLTNEDSAASQAFAQAGGLRTASECLLIFTHEAEYDILALALGLLINCVEHSKENQQMMCTIQISSKSTAKSTSDRFADPDDRQPIFPVICNLFTSTASRKNGQPTKQAQDNAIAAYSALLIGCIAQEESNRVEMLACLQAKSFAAIEAVLRKFIRDQAVAGMGDQVSKLQESIEAILVELI